MERPCRGAAATAQTRAEFDERIPLIHTIPKYTKILLDIFVQLNSLPSTSIDLSLCFATLGGSAV